MKEKIDEHELTYLEIKVANHLMLVFKNNQKYRTGRLIRSELKRVFGISVNGIRLRKIIHYIRINLCDKGFVIAGNNGYKFTMDKAEMVAYNKSLDDRIRSQMQIWNKSYRIMEGMKND